MREYEAAVIAVAVMPVRKSLRFISVTSEGRRSEYRLQAAAAASAALSGIVNDLLASGTTVKNSRRKIITNLYFDCLILITTVWF
jgi:hypothetical protein